MEHGNGVIDPLATDRNGWKISFQKFQTTTTNKFRVV